MSENKLASKVLIRSIKLETTPERLCSNNPTRKRLYVQITNNGTCHITHAQNKPYTEGILCDKTHPYENTTTTAELWVISQSGNVEGFVEEDTD